MEKLVALSAAQIIAALDKLSIEDVRRVNKAAFGRLEYERQKIKADLYIGQKVQFTAKYGSLIVGTVIGKGPKNVKVRQENLCGEGRIGCNWTVSPNLIKAHA